MRTYLRLRLAWLRYWSAALYRRYAFTVFILVFMFGEAVQLVPDWPGRPLLAFARQPADWRANLPVFLGYVLAAALWARVHRDGIRGAALAQWVKASPLAPRAQRRVDLLLLLQNLPVLLVPVLFALPHVLGSAQPRGVDGWFWLYLPAILLLCAAAGKAAVYGARLSHLFLLGAACAALLAAPVLLPLLAGVSVGAALFVLKAPRHEAATLRIKRRRAPRRPWLVLLIAQRDLLLRHSAPAFLPRLLWAALPLVFTSWLVQVVGNHRDAVFFLHGGLCASLGIYAGGYGILARARAGMTHYAAATAHGLARLQLADHAVMLGGALLLVAPAQAFAAFGAPVYSSALLCGAPLLYLAMLLLFGWPRLYLHAQAVAIKFGLGLAFLFTGMLLS